MQKNLLKGSILEFVVDINDSKEMKELIKLIKKFAKSKSHNLCFTAKQPMKEFYTRLGQAGMESTQFKMELPNEFAVEGDKEVMYELIGRTLLNTYISKTYFVKSEADQKVYEIRGVK